MTYISKILINNFKSIKKYTEIPISPITLIFGPNSVGKSSVIDAINALRIYSLNPEINITKENAIIECAHLTQPEVVSETIDTVGLQTVAYKDPLDGGVHVLACPNLAYKSSFVGVEVGDFTADIKADDDYSENRAATSAGYSLYQSLNGSLLKIGTTQNFLAEKYSSHISKIIVDGECLLGLEDLRALISTSDSRGSSDAVSGCVIINLNHNFWKSVRRRDEIEEFLLRLGRLQEFDERQELLLINEWLTFSGGYLSIKGESRFLTFSFDSPTIITHLAAIFGNKIDVLPIIQDIRFVANSLKSFGNLVQNSIARVLSLNSISGDRSILNPSDLEFEYSDNSDNLSAMSSYAFQLASASVNSRSHDGFQDIAKMSDFVNDILRRDVFGVRKYTVMAEVWQSKVEEVIPRIGTKKRSNSLNMMDKMLVWLYLEDQNGRTLDFIDVGSGVSYIVPILASLQVYKTSWIAQPELHLHPAAQCAMGDVFVRAYNRQKFSVIETHSEHLLLRILRRIRETSKGTVVEDDLKCHPEAVTVLYFKPEADGGVDVRQLRVSRFGDFKDWT